MANNSRINPMYVDTASSARLVNDTSVVDIVNIIPIASNATWAVILKDGAGNVIYSASNVAGIPTVESFQTTGLVVDTLTNATCLIYVGHA
jgi:hypothetical protein